MAKIIPFKAIRPPREKVHLVASRSYINYSKRNLSGKLDTNPFSFIHIINPEYKEIQRSKSNSPERFKKVKNRYEEFKQEETFVRELHESFYIYRKSNGNYSWTGIIAGASVQDYKSGVIKRHEHTLEKREQIFKEYLCNCNFHAEPVLLTYPDNPLLDQLVNRICSERAEYEFMTTDRYLHNLWLVSNPEDLRTIQDIFGQFESIYIADGHHRSASSALLAGEQPNNIRAQFFMAYFIPETSLEIFPFHRVIKTLKNKNINDILKKIAEKFDVKEISLEEVRHLKTSLHNFIMLTPEKAFVLSASLSIASDKSPIHQLDSWILSEHILSPILGITDLRTDKRVEFNGGEKATEDVLRLIYDRKIEMAFILHPVSIDQMKMIADCGLFMPPKSTWIEPKLRSGIVVYEF